MPDPNNDLYSDAWRQFAETLNKPKVDTFFDVFYAEANNLYNSLGHPNGPREEDFWEWATGEFFNARKRFVSIQRGSIQISEENLKNNSK